MKKQDFTVLKIDDLHPFPDNPFHLVEDELLMEMAESIKEFGVVTPIIWENITCILARKKGSLYSTP